MKSAAQRVEEAVGFRVDDLLHKGIGRVPTFSDASEHDTDADARHLALQTVAISECERADRAEAEVERLKKDLSARLEAAEALVAGEKWVSVEDRLPERTDSPVNGRAMVLVVIEGDGFDPYVAPAYFELGEFQWLGGGELKGIRKWRPLPNPPSNGKDKSNG